MMEREISSPLTASPTVELIDDGYALCEEDSLGLVFCNAPFQKWLKVADPGVPLSQVLVDIKPETLFKRLDKRGYYSLYFETQAKARDIPNYLEASFKKVNWKGRPYIAVHLRDASVIKEKDALIESHAKLIERSNKELKRLSEKLKEENLRLSAEVEVARQLQQMLLPTIQDLDQVRDLDIACFMQAADEVGGDYYDILQYGGRTVIAIGDVTGHGLRSGVVMLMAQVGVRALMTSDEGFPVRFFDVLNRTIHADIARMGGDKSLTLAVLDYKGGEVRMSGQHEEMIVVRRDGAIELVDTLELGFPIGLDDDIARFIKEKRVQLRPGDGIVLYTDGFTEAENPNGEQYGLECLCKVIRENWAKPADAIKEAVVSDVRDFIDVQTVYDDLTLVVLKQR
ncbi:MAG: PP2C family protein-serine/threonine phosphatase [Gammaproteobacteria bacterium]